MWGENVNLEIVFIPCDKPRLFFTLFRFLVFISQESLLDCIMIWRAAFFPFRSSFHTCRFQRLKSVIVRARRSSKCLPKSLPNVVANKRRTTICSTFSWTLNTKAVQRWLTTKLLACWLVFCLVVRFSH